MAAVKIKSTSAAAQPDGGALMYACEKLKQLEAECDQMPFDKCIEELNMYLWDVHERRCKSELESGFITAKEWTEKGVRHHLAMMRLHELISSDDEGENENNAAVAFPEVRKLRAAIIDIDALSQEGFSEIKSIAKLALSRLETPDGYLHIDDIANALKAIWSKADVIQDCIDNRAEGVGCSYVDEDRRRRWDAMREARCEEVRT